jgi:hypothetical protein
VLRGNFCSILQFWIQSDDEINFVYYYISANLSLVLTSDACNKFQRALYIKKIYSHREMSMAHILLCRNFRYITYSQGMKMKEISLRQLLDIKHGSLKFVASLKTRFKLAEIALENDIFISRIKSSTYIYFHSYLFFSVLNEYFDTDNFIMLCV